MLMLAARGAMLINSHAIQLVGYNLEEGWWLAKNTWGTGFAEGGFFRVSFNASVGIGNADDTYGLRFNPYQQRSLPVSRLQALPGRPGCIEYRAAPSDYIARVAFMFGQDVRNVLLININSLPQPDMMLQGLTVIVCGLPSEARSSPPPSPKQPGKRLSQLEALLQIKKAIDQRSVLQWQLSRNAGATQYCTWPGVECNAAGSVEALSLEGLGLVGSLPRVGLLLALPKLEGLDLANNIISGPLPAAYGQLTGLKRLRLLLNPVGGTLPCSLSAMVSLEELDIAIAQLTGTLCPDFREWRRITIIRLHTNALKGRLPPEYGAMRQLTFLALGNNALTGPIPGAWQGMAELQTLSLFNNKLTGTLPPSLGVLEWLQEVAIYKNRLTGPLPPEWSGMVSS
jgi:hypothetical protein